MSVQPDGKQLMSLAKDMFNTDNVTPEQIAYVIDMLQPSTYLLRNHTIKGSPMTFYVKGRDLQSSLGHRPWQIGIVNSDHTDVAVIKSRQLGMSELSVGKMFYFLDIHSYDSVKGIYAFPTNNAMKSFVKERLNPLLSKGYYSTIISGDSLSEKYIRDSFVTFRSSSKPGSLEGIPADIIFLDEYDRANPAAVDSARETMSSSKYQILNRWSTPSIPDYGVHRLFAQSDQKWYLHKCDKCNHWNQMDYADYDSSSVDAGGNIKVLNPDGVDILARTVIPESFQYVCKKCGRPLDRFYNGQWVAKYPDRIKGGGGVSGFMISQLNAVWISASQIKEKELNSLSKQMFHNYVLGMPYEDQKLSVKESDIFNNLNEHKDFLENREDYRFVALGIDWGNTHWLSALGMRNNGQIDLIGLHAVTKSGATDVMNIGADLERIKLYINQLKPDIILADIGVH